MKIHALQTGTVQVKDNQQKRAAGMPMLNVLFRGEFTEPLPIHAWLIEHPDGLILVDTGETSRTQEAGYFPRWHPYFKMAIKMAVRRDQEIDKQIEKAGFKVQDVKRIILTHMHTDHCGGLYHFPHAEFYMSETENDASKEIGATINGYLPQHRPEGFAPKELSFSNSDIEPFEGCFVIADGIFIISTPGHTDGHISVLVQDEDVHYFIAGDTSYTQDLMINQSVDGVSSAVDDARHTLESIYQYTQQHPTVYLPSHDPDAARRLREKEIVPQIVVEEEAADSSEI